jgi:hypothetical protein
MGSVIGPTPEQIERGTAALVPFVQEWRLPLNPENLDALVSCWPSARASDRGALPASAGTQEDDQ